MQVTPLHLLRQGPVLEALFRTALASRPGRRRPAGSDAAAFTEPRPAATATLSPRAPALIRDYLRAVGGDPDRYRDCLPPHLFPQWGFPLLSRNLRAMPWDLTKVLNAGVKLEIHRPLPAMEPLQVSATLLDVDANDRRVLIRQRLETGTASAPGALVAETTAILPLARADREEKKDRPLIPEVARELARWSLPKDAGLEFAVLTGDINPIHWLRPYARLAGFPGPILHGFGILARTIESLNRALWSGETGRLAGLEARFVRPLPLPSSPGVFVDDRGGVFVGEAPGEPAYMVGQHWEKETG